MLKPRRAILEMAPYSPPSSGREGKIRLDFNENTVGCSPKVVSFLAAHFSTERLTIYPEYEETRRALSRYFGLPESCFTLCNGTDEAIQVLVHTYVGEGDRVLVCHPSYAMYRFYAQVAGARVEAIPYRTGDLAFPLEELLERHRAGCPRHPDLEPEQPDRHGHWHSGNRPHPRCLPRRRRSD